MWTGGKSACNAGGSSGNGNGRGQDIMAATQSYEKLHIYVPIAGAILIAYFRGYPKRFWRFCVAEEKQERWCVFRKKNFVFLLLPVLVAVDSFPLERSRF